MTGHVVGTFISMSKMGVVIRDETIEIIFQVPPCGWVCIFHKDEAAAGVPTKDNADSAGSPRSG